MSNDIQKYVKLSRLVAQFLDENLKSQGDRHRAWQLAFRALVKLGLNIAWEPLTVRIPVSGNLTVPFPPDCLIWTKLGVLNNNGEISALKINNAQTKLRDTNPNRLNYLTADVNDAMLDQFLILPYFINFYANGYFTPLFGIGNGLVQYGECTVDEKNRVVVLSQQYPFTDLMFEYISSPEENEDYQIEIFYQEAVIAFLNWKFKLGSKKDFYDECIEARRQADPLRKQVFNQVIRESNGYKVRA